MRTIIPIVAFAVICVGQQPASRPAADAPTSGQTAFEAGLRSARDQANRGQHKSALALVDNLLSAHEGAAYAFAQVADIGDLIRKCKFAIEHPDPNPKDLVSGELLAWDARSGSLKVRYIPSKMKDWGEADGAVRVHPAVFRGPYSIELKGERYPSVKSEPFKILVCVSEQSAVLVLPGAAAENEGMHQHWLPGRLICVEGESEQELDKKEHPPCRGHKPYAIKVRVNTSEVAVTFNSQSLMSGRRPKHWGQVAFVGARPDEIVIEGKAEASWIQGLVDEARQKNLSEFDRKFILEKHLPRWLAEGPRAAARTARLPAFPDTLSRDQRNAAERIAELYESDDIAKGLALLDQTKPSDLPAATRSFLLAMLLEAAERPTEAALHVAAGRKAAPAFWQWDVVEARILASRGRFDQAADLLATAAEAAPNDCNVVGEAAVVTLRAGRASKAKALVDAAIGRRVKCEGFAELSALLVKAINGPPWPQRFEYKSRNFVVTSDIDRKTCEDAARLLEESYLAYSTWLERVPNSATDPFRVYLFSGETGYRAWTRDLLGATPEHTAGLYSPLLKILMIWNLPSREEMMRTVRHEGFHQYLDRLVAHPPTWFNEGLAEYFESARLEAGTWKADERDARHLRVLAENDPAPLEAFLFDSPERFYRNPELHYAQAWALITFLRHSTAENKQLFQKLWKALRESAGTREALEATFTTFEIRRVEREFSAWLRARRG